MSTTTFTDTYAAAGNRRCQPSCLREPTPQEIDLSYDNERRLTPWYHGGASTTVNFAYDGAGNRVAQSVTTNDSTTTTRYLAGGLEEVTTAGSTTTLTKYEAVPGVCSVVIVGSGSSESVSYVTTDGLGSVSEALDGNGNVTAQQLYGPYGGVRYSSGTMPTAKGYTGQYADAATGLDYYNARYYDAAIGQFASADSVDAGGLNRYAYVSDNPETQSDPSGHCFPLCLVAAAIGAVVGLGVGVAAATSDGQGWSLGNVAHVAADVALGATAGAALTSGNPGAELGAGMAVAGVIAGIATGTEHLSAATVQSAFESVALGADAGFIGDDVLNPATIGKSGLTVIGGNMALAGATDAVAQGVTALGNPSAQWSWGEFGASIGMSAVASYTHVATDYYDPVPARRMQAYSAIIRDSAPDAEVRRAFWNVLAQTAGAVVNGFVSAYNTAPQSAAAWGGWEAFDNIRAGHRQF